MGEDMVKKKDLKKRGKNKETGKIKIEKKYVNVEVDKKAIEKEINGLKKDVEKRGKIVSKEIEKKIGELKKIKIDKKMIGDLEKEIKQNPIMFGLISFTLGLMIGSLFKKK